MKFKDETLLFLIKYTPAAVAMFDTDMRYIAHSDRWLLDYELQNQDIIGKTHYEVFPDILERWKDDHRRVLAGKIHKNEEDSWTREDGTIVYIRYELRPWRTKEEEIGGLIMFTEVITETVETRKKLEIKNNELEDTILELKRSNDDLEQFAFISSHDFKEPLRSINIFSQLLGKELLNHENKTALEYVRQILKSINRMQKLSDSLLTYSEVDKNGNIQEKVDVKLLIEKQIENIQLKTEEKNIKIDVSEIPKTINCNERQLGLVFFHLIENGLKFNNSNQPSILISSKEEKDFYLFTVKDNGIGLEQEDHDRAFKLFQKVHKNEKYSGTGIGLALAHKIIEKHGGNIGYQSNKKSGSTFFFTLEK